MEKKSYLILGSSDVLRDPEMGLRTMKIIHGVGYCQLLEIWAICEVD
jgi:hypothetical protein